MDDEKIQECWVVLTDCRAMVPVSEQSSSDVHMSGDETDESSASSTASGRSYVEANDRSNQCRSPETGDKTIQIRVRDVEGMIVSHVVKSEKISSGSEKRTKFRKHPALTKTLKKKGAGVNTEALPHLKECLIQKYGNSLLRKPSFSFEGDAGVCQTSHQSSGSENKSLNQTRGSPEEGNLQRKLSTSQDAKLFGIPGPSSQRFSSELETRLPHSKHDKPACDNVTAHTVEVSQPEKCDARKGSISVCSNDSISPESFGVFSRATEDNLMSDSACELITGPLNQCFTNPSCPMPEVGLTLQVGLGRKLMPLEAKCVLTCLDNCRNSITTQYAAFSASVIKSTFQRREQKVILPIKDKRILELMDIKWKSKSTVRKQSLSNFLMRNSHLSASTPKFKDRDCSYPMKYRVNNSSHSLTTSGDRGVKMTAEIFEKVDKEKMVSSNINDQKIADPGDQDDQQASYAGVHHKKRTRKRWSRVPNTELATTTSDVGVELDVDTEKNESESKTIFPRKRAKFTLLATQKERSHHERYEDSFGITLHRKKMALTNGRSVLSEKVFVENEGLASSKPADNLQQPPYDPDDCRGINSPQEVSEEHTEVARNRKSHLIHELRRLNVTLFDMTNCYEPVVCKFPDICRLGCVCSSLTSEIVRDNCGLEKCMFECTCLKPHTVRRESYAWMHNKAKANLAKEERHFKQTVVCSGKDNVVLVEGKRKREIKLPERYREDFISTGELQSLLSTGLKDKDTKQPKIPRRSKDVPVLEEDRSIIKPENSKQLIKQILTNEIEHSVTGNLASNAGSSARTMLNVFKSQTERLEKQRELLHNSSCEKINIGGELKMLPTQSFTQDELEGHDGKYPSFHEQDSCSFIFQSEFIQEKRNGVILLSRRTLQRDVERRNVYVWLKPKKSKLKIFLTQNSEKPYDDCLDLQAVHKTSDAYLNLPFHLHSLRSDYIASRDEEELMWIVRNKKNHWLIEGYLQPSLRWETPIFNKEVDILSSVDEQTEYRWWVMDTRQDFDLIYFLDFKKAMTKRQLTTLLKLSNEYSDSDNKVHRILLNRQRPNEDPSPTQYSDFGAYSLPNHPYEFMIGPYTSYREPRFQVYSQKVAHNGKTEYEKIPLFYCKGEEFVRVNSRGVLSLQSVDLPEKFVKGTWFLSCGVNLRVASTQIKEQQQVNDQVQQPLEAGSSQSAVSVLLNTNVTSSLSLPADNSSNMEDERKGECSHSPSRALSDTNDELESSNYIGKADGNIEASLTSQEANPKSTIKVEPQHPLRKTSSISILRKSPSVSSSLVKPDSDDNVKKFQDSHEEPGAKHVDGISSQLEKEYLIPDVKEIGFLLITHLPGGALSVPHFTDSRLLKFYRSKEEIIRELNMLIHHKLSCLSKKCSIYLKKNADCKCVEWKSTRDEKKCSNLPQFKPEIFKGSYMLTKYGLVDLQSADPKVAQTLGQDWIQWLKNDEVTRKLHQWETDNDTVVTERHYDLMRTLTSNDQITDLSLLQLLVMATNEIAKLKAEGQLLDYEYQTQRLMKETLISSLCRKMNGIPGHIVPQLLEQLEFNLVWEILECMDSRSINCIPLDTPVDGNEPVTELSGIVKSISHATEPKTSVIKKKQNKMKKRESSDEQKVKKDGETLPSNDEVQTKPQLSPSKDPSIQSKEKQGLFCNLAPFSCPNVCVEEGGIKCAPLPSPLLPSTPCVLDLPSKNNDIPTSPGKPNILRRSLNLVSNQVVRIVSPISPQKQARKQKFSVSLDNCAKDCQLSSESVGHQNSLLLSHQSKSRQEDPISSLRISSVMSGDISCCGEHETASSSIGSDIKALSIPESKDLTHASTSFTSTNLAVKESVSDSVSSLRISSVYSTGQISSMYPATEVHVPASNSTSCADLTSLRLASAVSTAAHSALPVLSSSSTSANESPFKIPGSLKKIVLRSTFKNTTIADKDTIQKPHAANSIDSLGRFTSPISSAPVRMVGHLRPTYSVSKHGNAIVKTEVPTNSLRPQAPKPIFRILQKNSNSFSLAVPMTSLKILPLNALPKSSISGKAPLLHVLPSNSKSSSESCNAHSFVQSQSSNMNSD